MAKGTAATLLGTLLVELLTEELPPQSLAATCRGLPRRADFRPERQLVGCVSA